MTFVRRVCRICGHDTVPMTACGRGADRCDGHEARPHLPITTDIHDHCREGCWCTYGGCMAERAPLRPTEHIGQEIPTVDANEFLMSGGAKAILLENIGDSITMQIIGTPEIKQDMDNGKPKTFPSGDLMYVITVPVQTALRNDADDDGVRTWWCGGRTIAVTREAVKATGATGLEIGGVVHLAYVGKGEKKGSYSAPKIYTVQYQRPAPGADANAALMTQQPPSAAQQAPAQFPAGQPYTPPPAAAPSQQYQQAPAQQHTPNPAYVNAAGATPPPGVDPAHWSTLGVEQRSAILAAYATPGAPA